MHNRPVLYILFFLFGGIIRPGIVYGTHNRAGEITLQQKSALTYQITITTFTYTLSPADRDSLEVSWGDNSYSIATRINQTYLPDYYKKNTYITNHTFPGPGTYEILVQDPNRNLGVKNIPNSVNVIFSIKTTIVINPEIGQSSTPLLLNYPIDKALLHQKFIHNPAAYDIDGDSLSYKLTICTGEAGIPIDGYTLPPASDTIYVDAKTGDFVWDSPTLKGIYNVAMLVEEWRDGIRIGGIVRDMQIEVIESENQPPVIDPLYDLCVIAGDTINATITAHDPDGDSLHLFAAGGPFIVDENKAKFSLVEGSPGIGITSSIFNWITNCSHVRDEPYSVVIKAEDYSIQPNGDTLKSVDIENFVIKVLGPPVQNVIAQPSYDHIKLTWNAYACNNIKFFEIYRREYDYNYIADTCENGVPVGLSFKFIGKTDNGNILSYDDIASADNELQPGISYCYLVFAKYTNNTLSIIPDKVCANLLQGTPTMIQTSVVTSDATNGSISVKWIQPPQSLLDTLNGGAPYRYYLFRRSPGQTSFQLIDDAKSDLTDTTYVDGSLNTFVYPYYYYVELYYTNAFGNLVPASTGGSSSSTWLTTRCADNTVAISYQKEAPWVNIIDSVFYKTGIMTEYQFLGLITDSNTYIHTNLINNNTYYYQIKSLGIYHTDSVDYFTQNTSHIISAVPIDTIPPCPPDLSVTSYCDSLYNFLVWNNPEYTCNDGTDDVIGYNIYYSSTYTNQTTLVASRYSKYDTTYIHSPLSDAATFISLAACYQVTAIDSFGNESAKSVKICVDSCNLYKLPNVFTPNDDGDNDIYYSYNPFNFVQKVDMKIYNRWGKMVYETTNPAIAWDGRDKDLKQVVGDGVYYYTCDVYEPRITGIEIRNLIGFIHVFTAKTNNTNAE